MLQWEQLNSTATHTVWGYVSRRGGGLAMTPLQKFEPSEFVMDLIVLAWKLPDLPLLCCVCVLLSASLLSPILSQLPTSRPTPHLPPSNSGSAEHLAGHYWSSVHRTFLSQPQPIRECLWWDNLELGQKEGSCWVWGGATLTSPFYLSFLFFTWAIPLTLPLEFLLHHYHRKIPSVSSEWHFVVRMCAFTEIMDDLLGLTGACKMYSYNLCHLVNSKAVTSLHI